MVPSCTSEPEEKMMDLKNDLQFSELALFTARRWHPGMA